RAWVAVEAWVSRGPSIAAGVGSPPSSSLEQPSQSDGATERDRADDDVCCIASPDCERVDCGELPSRQEGTRLHTTWRASEGEVGDATSSAELDWAAKCRGRARRDRC